MATSPESLQTSSVWWGNYNRLGQFVSRLLGPSRPPLLILSLPRCGSSWVGGMLGFSASGLYLREPLTQSKLDAQGGPSVFAPLTNSSHEIPASYRSAAQNAFSGVPRFSTLVVKDPNQWRLSKLAYRSLFRKGRVVIKEVNPLALQWLVDTFRFKLLLLLRHPAAVAASWYRLGWKVEDREALRRILGAELFDELPHQLLDTHWRCHGAMQAAVYRHVFALLDTMCDTSCKVVCYENICRDPEAEFECLFQFAGFPYKTATRDRVRKRSSKDGTSKHRNRATNPYSTQRVSRSMIGAWRDEVPRGSLNDLKDAYLSADPPVYRDQTDWILAEAS